MKKMLIVILSLLIILSFVGCEEANSADSKQAAKTEALMTEMNNQVGLPNITNFFEKKMAKDILELRDDSELITYAYTKCEMTGKFVYISQAMGFGLPYSVEYTNPERIAYSTSYGVATLPQADPNGLFPTGGTSATWIMLISEAGEREISYFEDPIDIFQSKLPRRVCDETSLPSDY